MPASKHPPPRSVDVDALGDQQVARPNRDRRDAA
jgi:hypothetical protein